MKNVFILAFAALQFSNRTFGQCPQYDLNPPRLDLAVKCFVKVDDTAGIFGYGYSISNLADSRGCLDEFDIDISCPPLGVELSNEGLVDSKHVWRTPLGNPQAQKVIPVGIPILPSSGEYTSTWWAAFGVDGSISWTSPYGMFRVSPGTTLDSVVVTSHGIPSLRRFVASPSYNPKPAVEITPENEDSVYMNTPEPTAEQDSAEVALEDSIKVRGWTIGPTAPPLNFDGSSWLDTLTSYTTQSRSLGWIKDQARADKYSGYFASAKTSLQQNNTGAARSTLQQVVQQVNIDSTSSLTSEAYALIRYNTEYLLAQIPVPPSGFIVKLISSTGTKLTSGSLQYYEGNWKEATNNNDGTFTINTTAKTLSLRMTYEYGTQTKSNVTVGTDTAIFQTVNAQIKLQDSKGNPLDTGTVQYYAGAWRNLGTTTNGVATKELLPNSYSFRMTYAYGSNDKSQDIGANPAVVFQTVNATVQLQDSHGTLMPAPLGDQGTVQYYSGAWRDLGTTTNGVATKELLPNSYSFRMTYAYGGNDKQQNISTNPSVVFQTVNATVQLKNSQGNLIDTGTVQYYAGAWRTLGVTSSGTATKELLPNNYSFRMTYAFVSNDKAQDISTNSTVVFSTVLCTINVTNSQSQPVNNVQASYYSGAWWQIGPTVNGQVTKELLPANLTFRITYGTNHQDKTQNLSTNNVVQFTIQP